jgi:hypothetical protein
MSWQKRLWKEGKYIDFWNINHFLGGILLAQFSFFLNLQFTAAIILSLLILISWEIFEYQKIIKETKENQVLDIITALIGFLTIYFLQITNIFLFISTLTVWILLTLWGFFTIKKTN